MFTKFVMKLMSSVRAIARWEAHRLCSQMDKLAEDRIVISSNLRVKTEAAEELKASEIKAAEAKADRTVAHHKELTKVRMEENGKKLGKKAEAHNSLTCALYPLVSKEL